MSAVSRIFGFKPVKYMNGAAWNGASNLYFIPAADGTATFTGDAVKLTSTGARTATGAPVVTRVAAATDLPIGVVVGWVFSGVGDTTNMPPVNDLNTPIYRRASTDRYCFVVDDPAVVYETQFVGTSQSAAAIIANVNLNGQFFLGTGGNTSSGASSMQLDSAGLATTSTLPLRVVGYPNRPDNIPGDTYFNYWVKFNNSQNAAGAAGV